MVAPLEPSEAERSACVLAAHRLREAVLREASFPLKFDGGLREALRACLPRELSSGGSCHSKVLGVASAVDGSYAAYYRVDAAALGRGDFGYGTDLRFTVGEPGRWRVEDVGERGYEWRGDWDVRRRPWLKRCGAAGGWSRPYADPVTRESLESYVVPLRDGDGAVVAVVVAGTYAVGDAARGGGGGGKRRAAPPAWCDLPDPKLRSRLLYPNPVCLLTTWSVEGGAWKKNVMTLSWLTCMNNAADVLFSLNAKRFSADAVVSGRDFGLSVPTADLAKVVLAVGGRSGRRGDKFADGAVAGLAAVTPDRDEATPKNGFAALMDDDSEDSDGSDGGGAAGVDASRPPPCFYVEGAVARLRCRVTQRLDGGDPDHHVLVARVEEAAVREEYCDGKTFAPTDDDMSPYLTFLGSQTFGHVARAAKGA